MKTVMLTAATLLIAGPAFAQTILPNPTNAEARAPRAPRARGITTAQAVDIAMTSNATCLANGTKTTTIVVDSAGVPIAMISNDGAAAITQRIAMGKALISLKTKMTSGAAAKGDAAAIVGMGPARPGAIPIKVGSDVVGAVAVSGSPTGAADEVCARAGLAKDQAMLK